MCKIIVSKQFRIFLSIYVHVDELRFSEQRNFSPQQMNVQTDLYLAINLQISHWSNKLKVAFWTDCWLTDVFLLFF